MIEPEPPPDEKYCVRIREYQFMKQPGVRAGKSERNSIPVLHTFTDKADNQRRVIGRNLSSKQGGVSHSFFPVEDFPSKVTFMTSQIVSPLPI